MRLVCVVMALSIAACELASGAADFGVGEQPTDAPATGSTAAAGGAGGGGGGSAGGGAPGGRGAGGGLTGTAASCLDWLVVSKDDGAYEIDIDGKGPLPPITVWCDMAGGGWTWVMNQKAGEQLPDDVSTVNAAGLGTLDQTYRLGGEHIRAIRPTEAWRLSDADDDAYFEPSCVVDWEKNYTQDTSGTACTIGYTSIDMTTAHNGGFHQTSARGIGINNATNYCSMRAYYTAGGRATTCEFTTDQVVQLWFR